MMRARERGKGRRGRAEGEKALVGNRRENRRCRHEHDCSRGRPRNRATADKMKDDKHTGAATAAATAAKASVSA